MSSDLQMALWFHQSTLLTLGTLKLFFFFFLTAAVRKVSPQ